MRKKRILAVLLSSAIAFSGMPSNVFAAEDVALEEGFSDGEDVTEEPTEEVGDIALEENQSQDSTGFTDGEIEVFTDENTVEDETDPEIQLFSDDGETSSDVVETGKCGNNLTYTITGDDTNGYTLTISGTGEMKNYQIYPQEDFNKIYAAPWYHKKINRVIIEEGVTSIGKYAFYFGKITGNLVLPNSIETIEEYAFYGCDKLSGELVLPNNLKTIGKWAFSGCSGLTGDLVLPAGLEKIEEYAFFKCNGFKGKLILPDSLKYIGFTAFEDCSGFSGDLLLPNDMDRIEYGAFYGCSGFSGKVIMPENLKYMSSSVFKNCTGIKSVVLPWVKKDWYDWNTICLFENCTNLEEVTIPLSVAIYSDEYDDTFKNCISLKRIYGYEDTDAEEYAKKKNIEFIRLEPRDIDKVVAGEIEDQKYTGESIKPLLDLRDNGYYLSSKEYNVEYVNNILPGTATAIVTGKFRYSGVKKITFKIIETEHSWSDWKVVKFPTINQNGEKYKECIYCGEKEVEAIPKTEPIQTTPPKYGQTIVDDCVYINTDMTLTDFTFTQNVVVKSGCTLTLYGENSCEKNMYIFGKVINRGTLIVKNSLCCLRYNNMMSAGNYNYGYFYNYGKCDVDTLNVLNNYLNYYYVQTGEQIPVCEHEWTDWKITKSVSCTVAGEKSKKCNLCGEIVKEEIPATGHTVVTSPAVEATCAQPGKTEGSYCSTCGEVIQEQKSIPALGHIWNEGKITKESTCTKNGEKTYICTRCGESKAEEIPALGHSWDAGKVIKNATCTEDGEKTYTCTKCNKTRTEGIAKIGHIIVVDQAVPATCTMTGKTEGSHCSVCGEVILEQKSVPALGHMWDEGTITKEPTCTENGEKTYTCSRCNETKTEGIAKIEHTIVVDSAIESTCTLVGKTEGKHCAVCGKIIQAQMNVPKIAHTIVIDPAIPATCTIQGKTEGSHCSVCGEIITPQKTIAKSEDHNWAREVVKAATCTTNGEVLWTCTLCGTKKTMEIIASGHRWGEWEVIRESTAIEEGWQQRTCKICGMHDDEMIPKLSPAPTPTVEPINPSTVIITKGKTTTLKPDSSWKNVKYSSSNKKVATVDKKGKVKAVAAGIAKITVKSGSESIVYTITVPGTTAIKGIKSSVSIKKGKSYTLKPKLSYTEKADKVTYKSSNKKIATVSKKGVIKGKKKGTATITIKSGKITKKCKVKVK